MYDINMYSVRVHIVHVKYLVFQAAFASPFSNRILPFRIQKRVRAPKIDSILKCILPFRITSAHAIFVTMEYGRLGYHMIKSETSVIHLGSYVTVEHSLQRLVVSVDRLSSAILMTPSCLCVLKTIPDSGQLEDFWALSHLPASILV